MNSGRTWCKVKLKFYCNVRDSTISFVYTNSNKSLDQCVWLIHIDVILPNKYHSYAAIPSSMSLPYRHTIKPLKQDKCVNTLILSSLIHTHTQSHTHTHNWIQDPHEFNSIIFAILSSSPPSHLYSHAYANSLQKKKK